MDPRPISTTLYLRPTEYQTRYQIRNAAAWLVKKKQFILFDNAIRYLIYLQNKRPYKFKEIMAAYYDTLTDDKSYISMTYKPIDTYRTSHYKSYGDEPHMWY